MCDGGGQVREWAFYIQDMLEFGENVLSLTDGLDKGAFVGDMRTYAATLRYIELVGEAATHVPDDVRESHSDIPWRAIIGARNRLAHSYLHIDDGVIWSIIQDSIPDLLPKLRKILDSAHGDQF